MGTDKSPQYRLDSIRYAGFSAIDATLVALIFSCSAAHVALERGWNKRTFYPGLLRFCNLVRICAYVQRTVF
ncbi:MAG: hypothetical protein OSA77_01325 [Halioglobus sp.]|jgi:hypothetical protein|nr:hypothetical protein [Halioglobus sp.]